MCKLCFNIAKKLENDIPTLFTAGQDPGKNMTTFIQHEVDETTGYSEYSARNLEDEIIQMTFFGRVTQNSFFSSYGNWTVDKENGLNSPYKNKRGPSNDDRPISEYGTTQNATNARMILKLYGINQDGGWDKVLNYCRHLDELLKQKVQEVLHEKPSTNIRSIKQNCIIPKDESPLQLSWYLFAPKDNEPSEKVDYTLDPESRIQKEIAKGRLQFNGFPEVRQYAHPLINNEQIKINHDKIKDHDHVLIHCSVHPYVYSYSTVSYGFMFKPILIVKVHESNPIMSPIAKRTVNKLPDALNTLSLKEKVPRNKLSPSKGKNQGKGKGVQKEQTIEEKAIEFFGPNKQTGFTDIGNQNVNKMPSSYSVGTSQTNKRPLTEVHELGLKVGSLKSPSKKANLGKRTEVSLSKKPLTVKTPENPKDVDAEVDKDLEEANGEENGEEYEEEYEREYEGMEQ